MILVVSAKASWVKCCRLSVSGLGVKLATQSAEEGSSKLTLVRPY